MALPTCRSTHCRARNRRRCRPFGRPLTRAGVHLWWYSLKLDPNLESLHDEPEYQAMVAEIEADMAAQLARVREMERNGELEPIPERAAD